METIILLQGDRILINAVTMGGPNPVFDNAKSSMYCELSW